MSRSQAVRRADLRAMLRIVGEMNELPEDTDQRARHLLTELCRLVDAQVGLLSVVRDFHATGQPGIVRAVEGGWMDDRARAELLRYVEVNHAEDPFLEALKVKAGKPLTYARREILPDREWYHHVHVAVFRRAGGVDDCIYTMSPIVDTGMAAGFGLHRPWGAKHFGKREREIVRIFHGELGWFYRRLQPPPADDPVPSLPPYLQEVLGVLLSGLSEKEAAHRLGLSRHTVHDYVKTLYKRLDVSSRPELMARCLRRRATRVENSRQADG